MCNQSFLTFFAVYGAVQHSYSHMRLVVTWVAWTMEMISIRYDVYGVYVIGYHDDVIKWKHVPCYWPFVRGIHRSPVNSPHKGQWHGDFMLSLICAWINGWVNNREAGDLRCHRAHYDVIEMSWFKCNARSIYWWSKVMRDKGLLSVSWLLTGWLAE